eukprot:TRINITY_DN18586_c0_g1_i2.p1 TRINITY_DN18586_c0_g1~~TRINITY_DN18586_c0_g1_i2.p1  ORF type:complete len:419 (+),score=65.70 TRINITY_DN18586_c0_g1_i2:580-1836(+)
MRNLMDLAAAEHPDVVLHVADYLYKQGPCAHGRGCEPININEEWGDNWKGWYSDFYQPSLRLLAAAPWVVLRGNHEICDRGGHGYFLFLDPRPLPAHWDASYCLKRTDAYAVPFLREQFLVLDSADINTAYKDIDDPGYNNRCPRAHVPNPISRFDDPSQKYEVIVDDIKYFRSQFEALQKLSASHAVNFLATHRPILGVGCNGSHFVKLDWTLQRALVPPEVNKVWKGVKLQTSNLLDGVSAIFSGHMHWFEAIAFESDELPAQFVVGNGGTELIPNYMPQDYLNDLSMNHVKLKDSISSSHFGYTVMSRDDHGYQIVAHGSYDGSLIEMKEIWRMTVPLEARLHAGSNRLRELMKWIYAYDDHATHQRVRLVLVVLLCSVVGTALLVYVGRFSRCRKSTCTQLLEFDTASGYRQLA